MKAIDTNILIRLIARDEPSQEEIAERVLADGDVLILPTVLLEAEWVLRSSYGLPRERIATALKTICGADNVHIVSEAAMLAALDRYSRQGDFADLVHLALAAEENAKAFVTFDRQLTGEGELRVELV